MYHYSLNDNDQLINTFDFHQIHLQVGDRVFCINMFELWKEYAVIPAKRVFTIPDGMTFEEAASIPVNYLTAYLMLFDFGNLRKNKSVLVHMAAGKYSICIV